MSWTQILILHAIVKTFVNIWSENKKILCNKSKCFDQSVAILKADVWTMAGLLIQFPVNMTDVLAMA